MNSHWYIPMHSPPNGIAATIAAINNPLGAAVVEPLAYSISTESPQNPPLYVLSPRTRLLISAVTSTQIPKLLASKMRSIQAGVGIPAYAMNSTNAKTPDLVTPAKAPNCNARAVSSPPLTWIAVATAAGPAAAFAAMSRAARAKNVHTRWFNVV